MKLVRRPLIPVGLCLVGLLAAPKTVLAQDAIYFSPQTNLESVDVALIDRARKTLDIAMYAFTDRPIARALLKAADRGVQIRIYRDRMQIRDRGDVSPTLAQSPNIVIRVKDNSSRNIMHLKAYIVDGYLLREGSANWSPTGEGGFHRRGEAVPHSGRVQQDNDIVLTNDRTAVMQFEQTFDRLWTRSTNGKLRP